MQRKDYEMKNFEKIVPVLASGLVVAGLGTADAFAAENDNIPQEPGAPAEVQKQKTSAPSTEIQGFTTTDTEVTSDGKTQNTGVINFNVDSKGNATDDGSLTLTTIPDSATPRAAAPAPTNTDATIENTDITPDDSGTTIGSADDIKGENGKEGMTETEHSDGSTTIEIDGTVTPAPSTPTDADKDKVKNEVSEIIGGNNSSYNWDAIKKEIEGKYGTTVKNGEDGNSFSFTFTESSNPNGTSKPLTPAELGVILGETLTPVTNEDGTTSYTYKDTDGNTVTVQVNENKGTETSTTTWVVTVRETKENETITGSESADNTIIIDTGDNSEESSGTLNVWEILGKIDVVNEKFGSDNATFKMDEDGNVNKVTVGDGSIIYDITYEKKSDQINQKVDLNAMGKEAIFKLLFEGNSEFKYENGEIYKNGSKVTLIEDENGLTATYYNITVIKTTQSGTTDNRDTAAQAAKEEAAKQAVVNALNNALGLTGDNAYTYETLSESISVDLKNNTWSVTLAGDKTYTGTLSDVKATIDGEEVDIPDPDVPLTDGITIDGSASATVTVEEKISGTLSDSVSGTGVSGITADDVKSAKQGDLFGNTGEKIDSVDRDDKTVTIKTTITEGSVTTSKTYTFTLTSETVPITGDKGHKWNTNELPWDESERAWIFDLMGANAFVVNQAGTSIICYDSSVYSADTDKGKQSLIDIFKDKLDGGGNYNSNKVKYIAINDIKSGFTLEDLTGVSGNGQSMKAQIKIENGKVYIYAVIENGKVGGLSHFVRGPGSTTIITVENDYSGTSSSQYNGNGTGTGKVEVTPGEFKETGRGTASGVQYSGSLDYSYTTTQPGYKVTVVDGSTQTVRKIYASLTSTTTTPGDNGGDNGGNGGSDPTPPGGNGSDPTPPEEEIPDTNPPLVDIPEEEPPLVDVPEEEPPLVDVPEEEPPLVDIPDTQPPTVTIPAQKVPLVKAPTPNTVEILEEEVPLADVPETGESPMGLLAAAAACFSALGLGLLKKKRED